jgi:hypothetical protein
MLQTIFNFSVIIYLILSTLNLIWQTSNLPEDMKQIKPYVYIALGVNLVLLFLGIFIIFK